ncbi:acyl-CoA thioesterase YbgC [Hydrogenophaga sp. T4]|nr:acyl-CoA thioesterase YbgC [Hydrogenophaga sp. T4]
MFVVTDTQVRYLRPARLDDLLLVTARVLEVGKASLTIRQSALLKAQQVGETDVLLCEGSIRIGWVNTATMRPQRIPTAVLDVMALPGSPNT